MVCSSMGVLSAILAILRMQNAERRIQNEEISQFFILHSAFCIQVPSSVQPLSGAARSIEMSTASAIRPAHVCDRDKERCWKAILFADLARKQRRLAAESHLADAGLVCFVSHAII